MSDELKAASSGIAFVIGHPGWRREPGKLVADPYPHELPVGVWISPNVHIASDEPVKDVA